MPARQLTNKIFRTAVKVIVIFLPAAAVYWFLPLKPVFIDRHVLIVEIARTPPQRARGFQGRTELADYRGMLFIFEESGYPRFWMKNTFLPLSIAFLDERKTIVDIRDMEPLCEDSFYVPQEKAKYALEVNRGWFKKRGIGRGRRVFFW